MLNSKEKNNLLRNRHNLLSYLTRREKITYERGYTLDEFQFEFRGEETKIIALKG